MPLYEYLCEVCGRRTELLQRHGDPPLAACPHCGGAVKKQFSAPAFHLKGSGWYATDYAKKSGGGESSNTEPSAKSEAASESSSAGPAVSSSAGGSSADKPGPSATTSPSSSSKDSKS